MTDVRSCVWQLSFVIELCVKNLINLNFFDYGRTMFWMEDDSVNDRTA